MTVPAKMSADDTLGRSELAFVLAVLVGIRQPCNVWSPPGAAKSMRAQLVATDPARHALRPEPPHTPATARRGCESASPLEHRKGEGLGDSLVPIRLAVGSLSTRAATIQPVLAF